MSMLVNPYFRGGVDPYFLNNVMLCHCDGTNGVQSTTNVMQPLGLGNTITFNSPTNISTTAPLYGTTCLDCPGGGNIASATDSHYHFGTGDFTIEFAVITSSPTQVAGLMDMRTAEPQASVLFNINSGKFRLYCNGTLFVDAGTVATSTWQEVCYSRVGGTGYFFVSGSQIVTSFADTTNYIQNGMVFGSLFNNANAFVGRMDEIRVTVGVGRYTSNYSVATAAFPDS